jgi:hypothetical protein
MPNLSQTTIVVIVIAILLVSTIIRENSTSRLGRSVGAPKEARQAPT